MGHGVCYHTVFSCLAIFPRTKQEGNHWKLKYRGGDNVGFYSYRECGSLAMLLWEFCYCSGCFCHFCSSFLRLILILANPAPEATSLALSFYFYTLVSGPNE